MTENRWNARADEEHYGAFDLPAPLYALEKRSSVRAMMTNASCVRMKRVRLPRILHELYPFAFECLANATPGNPCHGSSAQKYRINVQEFTFFGKALVTPV
jgi:hypothetical protein